VGQLYNFNEAEILAFILVMLRVSAFLVSWPVFGADNIPASVKILMALVISILLFPTVGWGAIEPSLGTEQIIWYALKEVFIGLAIGSIARAFFYVLSVAGQLISVSLGLTSIQLFDPAFNDRSSAFDQFLIGLGTLFFLGINGHHLLLGGLGDSFTLIPLSGNLLTMTFFGHMGEIVQEITVIGIKISGPVLVAILFTNIAMAVIGRTVPQINVLITSIPVNIFVGLLVLFVSLPLILWQMPEILNLTAERVFQMMKSF